MIDHPHPADAERLNALSLIDRHAHERPDQAAVLFEGQSLTYRQLVDRSIAIAAALRTQGVAAGSRVGMIARNCPDYYSTYLGVLRAGGTLFPINADLSHNEIAHIVAKSAPALVVCDSECRQALAETLLQNGLKTPYSEIDALLPGSAVPASNDTPRQESQAVRGPDSVAVVIHTSGTTALPKGVVATDRMEVSSALALIHEWQIRPGDISVCALPLSYTFGLFTASFVALTAGATVLLFKKFNPVHVLEGIEKFKASYMVGVPAMFAMMLEHVRQTNKQYNLKHVRFMASSGAPIATSIKEDFHRRLNLPLLEYYALSECTPIFSFSFAAEALPPQGSSGRLIDGAEVKILDDEGQHVPPGNTGKLFVRSARLMSGYYQDPERNAAAFTDGWFNTGDLAYSDPQGFFYVVGRERDQVISGGHKIASAEVEGQILKHEAVAQAAVVGSPDAILGEIIKAVLVLKPGSRVDPAEIIAHCEQGLARHKIPRIVEFRDALPISPAGKVLKRQLVQPAEPT
ncbi:class I adenylate-forming enzyme family protein [Eoetvoesiella caeni]|uniref:Long-chain acyl-CoA synthetase n=1 Tax=Eoetvoesiella caeni TaxID=645616 RepID=A0A366HNI3_9BURK|nr:AMP-binding protein [Eoetvoesiella caeni]MCI2807054.1 AMP-binding protein [Eoetvoesiella caeni]NYT53549.1 AMP-binding protein [Eoetvoesiella caeni]RBP43535.1 long-chain acyl-CoA synthetase [Eoetvoesiella caeni]